MANNKKNQQNKTAQAPTEKGKVLINATIEIPETNSSIQIYMRPDETASITIHNISADNKAAVNYATMRLLELLK